MTRPALLAARRVRQTFSFSNGPRVLMQLASSLTPWRREELVFSTRDGTTVACPNHAGARVPVYEIFVEDTYRLSDVVLELPEDPVVLDIGGQIGCFSLSLASRVPGARVHAYEASPSTASWLTRNVRENRLEDRVTVNAVAVSDHHGTLELTDNGHGSGLNGLTAARGVAITVPCVTFADAVATAGGRVDLVKLDTEGAEYAIVLASEPAAWSTVGHVVMEYHDVPGHSWQELKEHFAEAGLMEYRHEPQGDRQGTVWLHRGA